MSPALATIIGLAIYGGAFAPLVWIAVRNNVYMVGAVYTALVVLLAAYHTGIFHRSSLTSTDVRLPAVTLGDGTQCRKILELMEESGFSVDRSDPDMPKLVGTGANQVPPEVRDVLIECYERQATSPEAGEQKPE